MRALFFSAAAALACLIGIAACGDVVVAPPADGGVDTGSGGDGAVTADAAKDTAPPTPDASPDTGPVDAGSPTPNAVSCGNATCTPATQVCCTTQQGAQTCEPLAGGCPAQTVPQTCDDRSDCKAGEVCCIGTKGTGGPGGFGNPVVECKANSCGTIQGFAVPQLCKTNAECTQGLTCVSEPCSGRTISTCGGINPLAKGVICP
jgi:hypothetical protein